MDPAKVLAVVEWLQPKTVTNVKSFHGLVGYYETFMKDLSLVETPMKRLARKGVKFITNDKCEHCFQSLKKSLITTLVLILPNAMKAL